MDADMLEILTALNALVEEENLALDTYAGHARLAELARIKLRLVGQLEHELARRQRLSGPPGEQSREGDDDGEQRAALADAIDALHRVATRNAEAIARHMEVTGDLLDALVAEARRVSSRRASTYGAAGELVPPDPSIPIAIDSHF